MNSRTSCPARRQLARQRAGDVGEAAALGERDHFGCDGADGEFHGGGHSSVSIAAGSIAARSLSPFPCAAYLHSSRPSCCCWCPWASACSRPTCRSGGAPCSCRLPADGRLPTGGDHRCRRRADAVAIASAGRAGHRRAGGRGVGESRTRRRFARLVSHVSRRARGRALFPGRRRSARCCRRRWWRGRSRRWRSASRSPTAASPRSIRRSRAICPSGTTSRAAASRCASCSRKPAGSKPAATSRGLLYRSPWENLARLPAFATSRGVRMLLGNDFESSALGFRLDHEPGGFYNVSPANTQLAAVIVERATGQPYETLPRRAPVARRWARVARNCSSTGARHAGRALLLARDRARHAARPQPARHRRRAWAKRGAARGLGAGDGARLARERGNRHAGCAARIDGDEALGVTDDNGSAFWVIPRRQLAILNIAERRWQQPAGAAGDAVEGHRGAAGRPLSGARIGSHDHGGRPHNARHGYESQHNDGRVSRQPRIRAHDARHRIHRARIPAPAEARGDRARSSASPNSISTGCSAAGPASLPSSISPKSRAARRGRRCALSRRCWTPRTL